MKKLYYKSVEKYIKYEIPKIKWSRFFASIFPIENLEDAKYKIQKIQEKYSDATHNCYAYRFWVNVNYDLFGNVEIWSRNYKYSDDWEPMNTAWKPILSAIEWEWLHNIAVVVTRYFGGTLLGIGGLIQAYSSTTKEAIKNVNINKYEILEDLFCEFDYEYTGIVMNLLSKYSANITSQICEKTTKLDFQINKWLVEWFKKDLFENTNGKVVVE